MKAFKKLLFPLACLSVLVVSSIFLIKPQQVLADCRDPADGKSYPEGTVRRDGKICKGNVWR
jgi:hypothetical protein